MWKYLFNSYHMVIACSGFFYHLSEQSCRHWHISFGKGGTKDFGHLSTQTQDSLSKWFFYCTLLKSFPSIHPHPLLPSNRKERQADTWMALNISKLISFSFTDIKYKALFKSQMIKWQDRQILVQLKYILLEKQISKQKEIYFQIKRNAMKRTENMETKKKAGC